MSAEISQQSSAASEGSTGSSQRPAEQSKTDHLSRLPPELLDYIFDYVGSELTSLPLSKTLHSFHQRALYRSVKIHSTRQLASFIKTLEARVDRASQVKELDWRCSPVGAMVIFPRLFANLPNLVEIKSTFDLNPLVAWLESSSPRLAHLRSLRLSRTWLTTPFIRWMGTLPQLRQVEFSGLHQAKDLTISPAPQVVELFLVGRVFSRNATVVDSSKLKRLFPSAKIVSYELGSCATRRRPVVRNVVSTLTCSLETLTIRDHRIDGIRCPLENLAEFTLLRELHLDLPFVPPAPQLTRSLLNLRRLVSLSLVLDTLEPDFLQLFEGPERLPLLEHLTLQYSPVNRGSKFDIGLAKAATSQHTIDGVGRGSVTLQDCDEFSQMRDWRLPFGRDIANGILLAEQVEAVAREMGINVRTNLVEVKEVFHRQIVEFFSRGIGRIVLYGGTTVVKNALELAEIHRLELPRLQIDLDAKIERENLEVFEVDMSSILGTEVGDECLAWNLRYKGS
ncbi:hypothetical protein JCM5350_005588 [Sporobolomyces pararoseus]